MAPRPSTPAVLSARLVAGLALVLTTGLLAGCATTGRATSPTTAVSEPTSAASPTTTATTTTTVPATTTTTVVPAAPQSSPGAASGLLITAWERGDRASAATVATASAVATLFAAAYDGEVLNLRQCSVPGPNPVTCSWGPYAYASPTNPLYDLSVSPDGTAWYVSGVTKLG